MEKHLRKYAYSSRAGKSITRDTRFLREHWLVSQQLYFLSSSLPTVVKDCLHVRACASIQQSWMMSLVLGFGLDTCRVNQQMEKLFFPLCN